MFFNPAKVVCGVIQEFQVLLDVFRPHGAKTLQKNNVLEISSYEAWVKSKGAPEADYFHISEHDSIVKLSMELKALRESGNSRDLCILLRSVMSRKIPWNCGKVPVLEEFSSEVEHCVECLYENCLSSDPQGLKPQLEFFQHLQRLNGNSALMLSGGASMGTHHVGVIKALYDQDLLPKFICGASSGAIMASIAYTQSEDEQREALKLETMEINMLGELDDVKSPILIFFRRMKRLLFQGFVFDTEVIKRAMIHNLGNMTFLEAYKKTGRVLNITVSSPTMYEMPTLLNYMTAPNVLIWSAVVTSCAVPRFFQPCTLFSKSADEEVVPWITSHENEQWIDGSVENDIPQERLSEMFNITHFIVNPHIYPFVVLKNSQNVFARIAKCFLFFVRSEVSFRLSQLVNLGVFPTLCHYLKSILNQRYTGDITIVHSLGVYDYWTLFSPAEHNEVLATIKRGEQATWPFIEQISRQLRIEKKLDEIILKIGEELESRGISSLNSSLDNLASKDQ